MTLSEYLAGLARKRFKYGETDCLMILADWVKIQRGFDPAATVRGTYWDEASCRAVMIRRRGIVKCIEGCVKPFGIDRTATPKQGDIGIVRVFVSRGGRTVRRPIGALCLNPTRWAVMTDRGLRIAELQPMTAWAI